MTKRILFVDDQSNVLAGLRRMLRSFRSEWAMEFAESGQQALAKLAEAPFDVVVSDMRMPGMDGAQLLAEVMRRHPETVRIVLSGQSDQTAILRTVGPAHQFLSKPCDPETLKSTVARACALRDKLTEPAIKRIVSQVTTLPSLPNVYADLVRELNSSDASFECVAELITRDVAMTAKLMQMVSSSFFGQPHRVESPAHAASMLGLDLLAPLARSENVFTPLQESHLKGYSLDLLVEHSLAVSSVAQQIAASQSDDKHLAEDARLAGMLHDVGQLVLMENLPDQYRETLALANSRQIPLYEAEAETLGANHADVGAYLLGLWGLPDPIVEAVVFHHSPGECPNSHFSPLTAVHLANVLVNRAESTSEIRLGLQPDFDYLARLGMGGPLEEWEEMTQAVTS